MLCGQINSKFCQLRSTILRPRCAFEFFFCDTFADEPISIDEYDVNGTIGDVFRLFNNRTKIRRQTTVAMIDYVNVEFSNHIHPHKVTGLYAFTQSNL